ncbi:MAG: DUF2461 domain-containing protein [Phenylobacterium sp.]|uniref:DUF2461 domain-containing protein n=1 Tax=Phenylobacterium sp. TaxID=1871053 RepID=UPI001A4E95F5|nr:DUF2461 domain-containing protein [Phenylobacterium sp.]MBL8554230.1 DUF2461 domain-containing protein [Phenylobacterium sp.]
MDAPFLGFPETQAFLKDLAANNDRAWFQASKARYERAHKAPAEAFAAELRPRLEKLAGVRLGAKIFRIHRDVRFSKDKSPYNTHLHIGFQHQRDGGEPRRRGGFYFGIDPTTLSLGVGAFDFGPADLDRYRKAVADDHEGSELAGILAGLDARRHDADLKRVPAPYPQDHPRAGLLKHKGLNVWQDLDPALAASPDLADAVMTRFEALDAVNVWLTEVLEGWTP